eukprot:m.85109 g.85109  ORF g.85109 m.85109 type:complete len:234 (+) comp12183_c1_seq11:47-748(+)
MDAKKPKLSTNEDGKKQHPYIVIPDDYRGYEVDEFCVPSHYQKDLERIMLPYGIIKDRIQKLAQHVVDDSPDEPIVGMCVLKGGYQFFSDLIEEMKGQILIKNSINTRIDFEFIRCRSYENEESTGRVKIEGCSSLSSLKGKNLLIVEDMIDTGGTMVKLISTLKELEPATIRVASLFVKRTPRSNGYKPHYTGFEVPDEFIVGYALDYNEYFRDLKHVAVLNDNGKQKYKVK